MARVCARPGRIVVADMAASDDPQRAAALNTMERLRDPSHTRALSLGELRGLFAQAGLPAPREAFYDVRADLDGLLKASFPAEGDGPVIRKMFEDSLADDGLGMKTKRRTAASSCPIRSRSWRPTSSAHSSLRRFHIEIGDGRERDRDQLFLAVDAAEDFRLDHRECAAGLDHLGAAGEAVAGRGGDQIDLVFGGDDAALCAVDQRVRRRPWSRCRSGRRPRRRGRGRSAAAAPAGG